MDKVRRKKLLELRRKKNVAQKQAESAKHAELLNAIKGLGHLLNRDNKNTVESADALLERLKKFGSLEDEVKDMKKAVEDIPKAESVAADLLKNEVKNVKKAIENIPKIESVTIDNISDIVKAQQSASKNKDASEYTSVRITDGKEFTPLEKLLKDISEAVAKRTAEVIYSGGGGYTIMPLVTSTVTGKSVVAVANADGTPIQGGSVASGTFDFMDGTDAVFMDGTNMAFMSG